MIACLCVSLISTAQQAGDLRLEFGVNAGRATGKAFGNVLGGDIRIRHNITDQVGLTLATGFNHFFEKDKNTYGQYGYGSPCNMIPVKGGIKILTGDHFYISGEAGIGFGFEEWKNKLLWSSSIGYQFNNGFDISAKYEDYTASEYTRQLALRLGYGFSLKKRKTIPARHLFTPKNWSVEFALNSGIKTTGDASFAVGADIRLQKLISRRVVTTFTTGLTRFFDVDHGYQQIVFENGQYHLGTVKKAYNYIPVKAGVKVFAYKNIYAATEAGVGFASGGSNSFLWSASAGVALNNGLDLSIKYEDLPQPRVIKQIAARIGYRFNLGR